VTGSTTDAPQESAALTADGEQRREGGRRRRRGRGGQGGDKAPRSDAPMAQDQVAQDQGLDNDNGIDGVADNADVSMPAEQRYESISKIWPEADPVETRSPAAAPTYSAEPDSALESKDYMQRAEHEHQAAPVQHQAPAYVAPQRVEVDPDPAPATVAAAPLAPAVAEAPAYVTPAATVQHAAPLPSTVPLDLKLPPGSGLELVETRSAPAPFVETLNEPARPRRVRPPRVNLASEPLEFVETRKDIPPAN
jgi:ribonuclease E